MRGLCDIHNHLLPGIDDGSKSVGMSLKMLEKYDALGITSVLPTPHIYQDLYPNTPTTIKNALEILTEKTSKIESPKVNSYAAEYMIDEVFMKNLQTSMPALLLNNEYILVEITFFSETTRLSRGWFYAATKQHYSYFSPSRALPLNTYYKRVQGVKKQRLLLCN